MDARSSNQNCYTHTHRRAMANAQARQEREAEAWAADVAAKKGAAMRRMMVSQLYCPDKVFGNLFRCELHLAIVLHSWFECLVSPPPPPPLRSKRQNESIPMAETWNGQRGGVLPT